VYGTAIPVHSRDPTKVRYSVFGSIADFYGYPTFFFSLDAKRFLFSTRGASFLNSKERRPQAFLFFSNGAPYSHL
jgi:hypothetical protein